MRALSGSSYFSGGAAVVYNLQAHVGPSLGMGAVLDNTCTNQSTHRDGSVTFESPTHAECQSTSRVLSKSARGSHRIHVAEAPTSAWWSGNQSLAISTVHISPTLLLRTFSYQVFLAYPYTKDSGQ